MEALTWILGISTELNTQCFFFLFFVSFFFQQNYGGKFVCLCVFGDFRKSSRKWRSTRRSLLGWPRWNWMYRIQRNYSIWLTVWNESWPWNHRSLEINNMSGCNNPVPRCNPWKESICSVLRTHCAKGFKIFCACFFILAQNSNMLIRVRKCFKNKSLDWWNWIHSRIVDQKAKTIHRTYHRDISWCLTQRNSFVHLCTSLCIFVL